MKADLQMIAGAMRVTKRAIEMRANREQWSFSEMAVRGGRRKLFPIDTLPADVARQVKRHQEITARGEAAGHTLKLIADVKAQAEAKRAERIARGEQNLKQLMAPLAPTVQARFDSRFAIVKSWENWFPTVQPMGKKASYHAYVEAFNAGQIQIEAEVRAKFAELSARSLQRWLLTYEKEGLAGLIDHRDGKALKDVNVFTKNPMLEKTAIALLISRPTLSIRHLTDLLEHAAVDQETGEVLFEAPSYHASRRFYDAWKSKNAELFMATTNPDEWKNKHMVAFGSYSEDVSRLNERWEMDATPADWLLQDEDGVRRYTASGVIDVFSRRAIYLFAPTPRAVTHKLVLRMAMLLWGAPEHVVTDNGADYVGKEFVGTLRSLNINHLKTDPFSPWQKPHIERMNETLLHSVLEAYSSFIGHSVAERSAIEARATFAERLYQKDTKLIEVAMPAHLLQERVNQWLSGTYEQRPHSGDGMDGLSPFEKAAQYRGEVRRITDERALDVLLYQAAGRGTCSVTKKGIRIDNALFIAPELALVKDKRVEVRMTEDYGKVVVYHDGNFVCVAQCPERTGISRAEVATHARQLQKQNIQAQRAEIKKTKVNPDAVVSSLLRKKAEAAGKLTTLPTPATAHTTPALSAAGRAARTLDGAVPMAEVPSELRALMDKRQAARKEPHEPMAIPTAAISVIPETPQLRFRKWLELDELLTQGGTIDDPKLTRWYGTYPQHPEHAVMKKRHQESLMASGASNTAGPVVHQLKAK